MHHRMQLFQRSFDLVGRIYNIKIFEFIFYIYLTKKKKKKKKRKKRNWTLFIFLSFLWFWEIRYIINRYSLLLYMCIIRTYFPLDWAFNSLYMLQKHVFACFAPSQLCNSSSTVVDRQHLISETIFWHPETLNHCMKTPIHRTFTIALTYLEPAYL